MILPDSSGTNLLAICSDADSDTTAARLGSGLREVLAGESTEFTLEYSCRIQDTDRQFMMGVLPFSANGASHAIIVTLEITDRQRVADELRFKERVMDEAPVGITISDPSQPDNPLIYANAAFERITGFPTDAVIGKNCRFLQGPDTDPDTVSMMRAGIDKEEPITVEVLNYRQDGEPFWNEVTIAPVRDESGQTTHFVGFQRDVTRRKQAEIELDNQRDQLAVLNRVIRHDIRNDMNVFLGWLDTLMEDADDEDARILKRLRRSSQHVVSLTKDVGDLVDAITEAGSPELDPIPVQRVVNEEVAKVRDRYAQRAQPIEVSVEDLPEVEVMADEMLSSVIANILNNAILHNDKESPRVTITASLTNGTIVIDIADNGAGIPPELRDDIFGRGEKGLESPGTGTGLYLVDMLIDRYNGSVEALENDPEGTIFRLTLPLAMA